MNYITQSPANQQIREGDTCVIYISEHMKHILSIEKDAQLHTKFGLIIALDLIGHSYGTKYDCKKGWVIPLRLTPELWTQLLPHRTQILYQADISMILLQLDIKPNSIVVESGTGSGSLSHAILRACLPHGFLYTFDINNDRVDEARKEFTRHGYGDNVKVSARDIYNHGYGDELLGKADACILDLPQTWLAIGHAYKVLKEDGARLCTFSPCIEQVQQNVAKMTELKLKDIVTLECLLRPFEVKTLNLRVWSEDVLDKLTAIEQVRFENIKNKISNPSKRLKTDDEGTDDRPDKKEETNVDSRNNEGLDMLEAALSDPKAPFHANFLPKNSYAYAKQLDETTSHSGYLTFASKRR